jgi:hypothetical protein
MNCDECKEQVLELIERETVDPDGVRAILARCPDCRDAFDQMKSALALVADLRVEEPPAAIDGVILQAAAARAPQVVPLRKRRLQPPPWAMAAIAMLAVGVGLWAIPRDVQLESDAVPASAMTAEEAIAAEAEVENVAVQTEPASKQLARRQRTERDAAKTERALSRPAAAKRRSNALAAEPTADLLAEAPASVAASDVAAGAAMESSAGDADSASPRTLKKEHDDEATATCKRKIAEVEARRHDDKDHVLAPEDELAVGKCYETIGDIVEARKWLRRAAAHPETKARAENALRQLAPE